MHAKMNLNIIHMYLIIYLILIWLIGLSDLDKNKRPMGHFAHLRKQFNSINIYDYIITLIKRRRKKTLLTLWEFIGSSFENKLESPSRKDALCQVCLKFAKWFWRKRILNFVNVFSLFRNYLPLEKGEALHLKKLESPLPKDALC